MTAGSVHRLRSRIILRLTTLFVLFILPQTLPAQSQDAWFGTWRLNLAKSTPDRAIRFKRATTKIEPWKDGLKVTYELVGLRGGVTHMEWIGRFDGKDYPMQGVDYVMTNAYRRIDDRSYEIVVKVDGIVNSTASVAISPDGKTLTTLTASKNAQGNPVKTTTVYERGE
jgi:hypothetical protein